MSPPCMPTAGLITQTPEGVEVPTVTAWNRSLPRSGRWGCLPAPSYKVSCSLRELRPGLWAPKLWVGAPVWAGRASSVDLGQWNQGN